MNGFHLFTYNSARLLYRASEFFSLGISLTTLDEVLVKSLCRLEVVLNLRRYIPHTRISIRIGSLHLLVHRCQEEPHVGERLSYRFGFSIRAFTVLALQVGYPILRVGTQLLPFYF